MEVRDFNFSKENPRGEKKTKQNKANRNHKEISYEERKVRTRS